MFICLGEYHYSKTTKLITLYYDNIISRGDEVKLFDSDLQMLCKMKCRDFGNFNINGIICKIDKFSNKPVYYKSWLTTDYIGQIGSKVFIFYVRNNLVLWLGGRAYKADGVKVIDINLKGKNDLTLIVKSNENDMIYKIYTSNNSVYLQGTREDISQYGDLKGSVYRLSGESAKMSYSIIDLNTLKRKLLF